MCLLGLNGTNQPNNRVITKFLGDWLQLNCGVFESLPTATVTWSKRDRTTNVQENLDDNVIPSVKSGMLYFRSLTVSHSGYYQCVVTNSLTDNNIMGSYTVIVNGEFVSFKLTALFSTVLNICRYTNGPSSIYNCITTS